MRPPARSPRASTSGRICRTSGGAWRRCAAPSARDDEATKRRLTGQRFEQTTPREYTSAACAKLPAQKTSPARHKQARGQRCRAAIAFVRSQRRRLRQIDQRRLPLRRNNDVLGPNLAVQPARRMQRGQRRGNLPRDRQREAASATQRRLIDAHPALHPSAAAARSLPDTATRDTAWPSRSASRSRSDCRMAARSPRPKLLAAAGRAAIAPAADIVAARFQGRSSPGRGSPGRGGPKQGQSAASLEAPRHRARCQSMAAAPSGLPAQRVAMPVPVLDRIAPPDRLRH